MSKTGFPHAFSPAFQNKGLLSSFFVIAVLVLFFHPNTIDRATAKVETKITQSPNDDRTYAAMTLKNKLEVLLISDPTTDKAAVSMDVAVGSAGDPDTRLGLAHFLEHMLFLGTRKYPEAGEYQAFIQSHGGSHNAFTSLQNTNYFFDINASDLEPAIDRFSQFFIAPLFTGEYIDRERHAVHSEYQSKLRDDGRRIYVGSKQAINPDHPLSRFSVGSLETLSNDSNDSLKTDVIDFYQAQYSANRMKLVILGKESIDQLKSLALKYFSAIENRRLPDFKIEQPQFAAGDLPKEIQIKTLKDLRTVNLSFPTPALLPHWKSNPLGLISSLVGYEGEGSLLALLKEKGWASGLSASGGQEYSLENSFNVRISMTPEGMKHIDETVELFFSFMQDLKANGVSEQIISEEKKLNQQAFQFLQKQEPMHYVTVLAQSMQDYPTEHWLDARYVLETPDQAVWDQFIAAITPDNMLLSVQSKEAKTDQKEKYFGVEYGIAQITTERVNKWLSAPRKDNLHIRNLNPFIAANTSVLPQNDTLPDRPEKLTSSSAKLWFKQDQDYQTPKADIYFTLISPVALSGASASIGLSLWTDMVIDQLNKPLYDALLAGHSASVYSHARGITVKVSGYSDKVTELSSLVAKAVRNPEFDPKRFKRLLTDLQSGLSNSHKEKPYNQLYRIAYEQLMGTPTLVEKEKAAENFSIQELEQLVTQFFENAHLKVLVHGNLTSADASQLASDIEQALQPLSTKGVEPDIEIKRLVKNSEQRVTTNIDHNDSALIYYLQSPDTSLESRAAVALLSEIISAPFYTKLRTEQQLGYIVFSSPFTIRNVSGISFVIQSPSSSPENISQSILQYLDTFDVELKDLSADQLERYKRSVVSRVMDKENTLKARSERYWREIDKEELDFNSREKLVEAVEALTTEKLTLILNQLRTRELILSSAGKK